MYTSRLGILDFQQLKREYAYQQSILIVPFERFLGQRRDVTEGKGSIIRSCLIAKQLCALPADERVLLEHRCFEKILCPLAPR